MLVVQSVSLADVSLLISGATVLPVVIAITAFVADFLLRAVRFWAMLQLVTNRRLPLAPTIAPFIASFGISDILPLRVGDGVRALWFSHAFTIPLGTVIGAMLVERILDLVTLVLLGVLALGLLESDASPLLVWNAQLRSCDCRHRWLWAVVCARGSLQVARKRVVLDAVCLCESRDFCASQHIRGRGADRFLASPVLAFVLSLSLWILEAVVLISAWASLGGALEDLLKPFTAFVFSTLGTLVPSLPGHFGSFEYFGIQAFALTGVDANMAAAVVLLAHLILWAPTAIFGIGWLLLARSTKASAPAQET